MAITGITITELNNIGNDVNASDVLPIVNVDIDETQKVTVQNFGNFILSNLANTLSLTVSSLTVLNTSNLHAVNANGNIKISNSNPTYGLFTDNLYYSNGQPWDLEHPAGSNGAVQFNDNNNFGASNVFNWDNSSNTLSVQNLNLYYANATTNQGTSQQALGILDQANQVIGWKTLPTNYVNVLLNRSGNNATYVSSITVVLRKLPIKTRNGLVPTGYIDIPTVA
jgi:hypothetical protein